MFSKGAISPSLAHGVCDLDLANKKQPLDVYTTPRAVGRVTGAAELRFSFPNAEEDLLSTKTRTVGEQEEVVTNNGRPH